MNTYKLPLSNYFLIGCFLFKCPSAKPLATFTFDSLAIAAWNRGQHNKTYLPVLYLIHTSNAQVSFYNETELAYMTTRFRAQKILHQKATGETSCACLPIHTSTPQKKPFHSIHPARHDAIVIFPTDTTRLFIHFSDSV